MKKDFHRKSEEKGVIWKPRMVQIWATARMMWSMAAKRGSFFRGFIDPVGSDGQSTHARPHLSHPLPLETAAPPRAFTGRFFWGKPPAKGPDP